MVNGAWRHPPWDGAGHAAGPGGGTPRPGIGRNAARELARHELAKPVYHPHVPLIQQILDKLGELIGSLHAHVNSAVPGGWWTLVAVMALAVITAGAALTRLGPVARSHRSAALLPARPLTAAHHRLQASRLAAAGDWAAAIREILRAVARELEERAILPPRTGRTADEFAAEAAAALPQLAAALRSAVRLFDEVCYGGRPGTPAGFAQLTDLDEAVRSARPVTAQQVTAAPAARRSPAGPAP